MDMTELFDLIESGIPFTELYRYMSSKYPHIDATWLFNMVDVAYTELKEEME